MSREQEIEQFRKEATEHYLKVLNAENSTKNAKSDLEAFLSAVMAKNVIAALVEDDIKLMFGDGTTPPLGLSIEWYCPRCGQATASELDDYETASRRYIHKSGAAPCVVPNSEVAQ